MEVSDEPTDVDLPKAESNGENINGDSEVNEDVSRGTNVEGDAPKTVSNETDRDLVAKSDAVDDTSETKPTESETVTEEGKQDVVDGVRSTENLTASDAEEKLSASGENLEEEGGNKDEVRPPPANVTNDLETINQKRQEEKKVFQKLIDDVTELESQLSQKKTSYEELQMKLDVTVIDLDNERGKFGEARNKVLSLEKELSEAEAKVALAKRRMESSADEHSAAHEGTEEDVQDLHMKVKKLTQDDEVKTQRVAHLEAELTELNRLVAQLEPEVGKDRIEALRHHGSSNGVAHNVHEDRVRVRGNEVGPDAPQSKVCVIL